MKKSLIKKILMFLLVTSLISSTGCSKGEFINQADVLQIYSDNLDAFDRVACECINIRTVDFEYKQKDIIIRESYGNKERFELDEDLRNELLVCFEIMQAVVGDEYSETDYCLSIGYSESIDNIASVDFDIYNKINKESYTLSYSKNDLSDFPLAIKLSDNWYYWWWGQV